MSRTGEIQLSAITAGRGAPQVWAVDVESRRYVFMAEEDADGHREAARDGKLHCPVPECPSPAFEAVGGASERRHHFRHVSGHKHSAESVHHAQGKAMLSQWASDRAPAAVVKEEMTLKEPIPAEGYLHRRADVGIAWDDGQKVALEVEYKVAEKQAWHNKQLKYRKASITSSWLIGHTSKHLAARGETWVRIGDRARDFAAAGCTLLSIDPEDRTITTLVVEDDRGPLSDGRGKHRVAGADDRLAKAIICSIDECVLDPSRGLVTPLMEECRLVELERQRQLDEIAATSEAASEHWRRRARPGTATSVRAAEPDVPYDERVALQPKPDLSNLNEIHCGHCAYRVMVGLPVMSQPVPPRYLPWRDWHGTLIAQPPSWAPGGVPLGRTR